MIAARHNVAQNVAQLDGNRVGDKSQQAKLMLPLLSRILDSSTDAAFCFESQGRFVYANKTAGKWLGYTSRELLRLSVHDIIPDLSTAAWALHQQAIERDGSLTLYSRHRTKEGRIFPVELTINNLVVDGREYYCTTIRDLSEQSSVAAALQQSQIRFQKLAAHVPGMIYQFRVQPDGKQSFTYVSASCRELFGLEPEAIQQNALLLIDQIHPNEREGFERSIIQSAQTLQPWRWEGQIMLPSGQTRWVEAASRPELQVNGDIIWDGLLIDISDRKATEVALQQHSVAMEASIDGMAILNADGKYRYLNAAHAQIYGYEHPQELLGQNWQVFYDTEQLNRFEKEVMPVLWQQGNWQGEAVGRRRDGTTFPQELSLTSLECGGLVCVVRDTTKRKQAEAALQQAKEELETRVAERTTELQQANEQLIVEIVDRQQVENALRKALHELQQTQSQLIQTEKLSSIGQLVAGVAHEINNPVSFIYSNLPHANQYIEDLLHLVNLYQQNYSHPPSAIQEATEAIELDFLVEDLPKLLDSMKMGAERIKQIVLSLRNFSRVDEARQKQVDIHEGIDNTLLLLRHRLKAKIGGDRIQVIKEYGELPLVECHAGQLNQVFMNLLSNAIDALEESGVGSHKQGATPTIRIHTEVQEGDRVAIWIADNGTGISENVCNQIFDPFFTTKPVGKGTGLGLSISYQIVVEKHGGQLQCCSHPGQGTEFLIQIPISQSDRQAA